VPAPRRRVRSSRPDTVTVIRVGPWLSDPAPWRDDGGPNPEGRGATDVTGNLLTELEDVRPKTWAETAELVVRAQAGDRAAFGELIEQFQKTVYAICLGRLGDPSEAQDLTQDVFLHVYQRLDQLREPERFAGWLRQVAVRMAINRATRRVP